MGGLDMSFADRLLEQTAPFAALDTPFGTNPGDWHILCGAFGAMFQPVEDLSSDTPEGYPGWSVLLDIERIPTVNIPYLAQFVGVNIPDGLSDSQQRACVRNAAGFTRGRPASIIAAAQLHLTGDKSVILRERDGSPRTHTIITKANETPNPEQTLVDLMEQKPGADIFNLIITGGQDFLTLKNNYATMQDVKTHYATMLDVRSDQG